MLNVNYIPIKLEKNKAACLMVVVAMMMVLAEFIISVLQENTYFKNGFHYYGNQPPQEPLTASASWCSHPCIVSHIA